MKEVNIKNKKASFEFQLLDKFTAGIELTGTEVKAIRNGKASIAEAYCLFINNELWLRGMHVSEYDPGSYNNHPPVRDRKLLLQRKEPDKLTKKLTNQGLTIIPLRLYVADSGYIKLDIALAQGKKMHDKRDSIKDKEMKRSIDRALKN
jgi:SsrA-binding protein